MKPEQVLPNSGEHNRLISRNPLFVFHHACFEFLTVEVLCQPKMNEVPRLRIKPNSVVVGKLANKRKQGITQGRAQRREPEEPFVEVSQVRTGGCSVLDMVNMVVSVGVLVAV